MTDPRVPVTPGIPETDNPATLEQTEANPANTPENTSSDAPDKKDIPPANEVLSGEDGNIVVQEFLSHMFGPDFENFRQQWRIKKG